MSALMRGLKRVLWQGKRRWIVVSSLPLVLLGGLAFYLAARPPVLPQAAIHLLDDVVLPAPGQTVLVFAPHPDDETIGAGGYIASSVASGASVKVVLVTDGNKGPLNHTSTRYAEFSKAMSRLGVPVADVVFLGLPDGGLAHYDRQALHDLLKEQVDLCDPDVVVYPHAGDAHLDHSTVGSVVTAVLQEEGNQRTAYQYLVHYKTFYPQPRSFNPSLYLLPPLNLVNFDKSWQRFMLPQEALDAKVGAVYSYRSQLRDPLLRSLLLSSVRQNELFFRVDLLAGRQSPRGGEPAVVDSGMSH